MAEDEYEYLQSKIEALEFLMRQLLVWHMRKTKQPIETALALQAQAAAQFADQIDGMADEQTKARLMRTASKIQWNLEQAAQSLENRRRG